MNNSSKFTQLGNIIFKGSAVRELAEAIQNETAQTEGQAKLFKVTYTGGITQTLPLDEKDFEARMKCLSKTKQKTERKHQSPLVIDMRKTNWNNFINEMKKSAKAKLISAISYKNELQDGSIIFQSQSIEEMEKRNLVPKNMKFNHEKVNILPDNTLLVSPSELYNIGL